MPVHKSTNYHRIAELYKILANPKRLAIINALDNHELSVDVLARKLNIRKANVSQHLAYLRHAHFVRTRRDGLRIYYRLTDPNILKSCAILRAFSKRQFS